MLRQLSRVRSVAKNVVYLSMKAISLTLIALCFLATASTWGDTAPGWPQWRGPSRDGQSAGPAWPASLDEAHLKSQWKVNLAPSYSGPVIQNGLVYTTETANKETEVVRAYALDSGKEQWKAEWEGVMRVPFFASKNGSWIRSTPASDGESLFVAGMRDVLVCLDARTGKERWRMDFVKKLGTKLPDFGFVCSPLLTKETVIVQAGASVVALKKQTGEIVWRSLADGGGMNGSAFSSPVIQSVSGRQQLLVQTRSDLCGLDPDSGKVLWKEAVPAFRGMNILTPIVHDGLIFTTTYGGKALGLNITGTPSAMKPVTKWELKMEGYMSSPVIIDGHAYVHLKNKRFSCVDLNTGTEKWTTKKKFGTYWSLIAHGKQILALDEKGELLLIDANPNEFTMRSRRKLDVKNCWAHLAISGDRLIVRSLKRLEVFRWTTPGNA
ncbi:MAG: outer membrane protein assembly factor BamB [Verrucomicrobiales bacterium]|jgi:outer membrane protein assembly factor BamB